MTLQIVVDTREKKPFGFVGLDAELVTGTLYVGDYSLLGMENEAAIESKSLSDYLGSISHDRDRFEREMQRGMALRVFKIVVFGATLEQIHKGVCGPDNRKWRSKMSPLAVVQTIRSWEGRYRVPIKFYATRAGAEQEIFETLRLYRDREIRRAKKLVRTA